eukprot:7189677-Prymnesium_polylepis.1
MNNATMLYAGGHCHAVRARHAAAHARVPTCAPSCATARPVARQNSWLHILAERPDSARAMRVNACLARASPRASQSSSTRTTRAPRSCSAARRPSMARATSPATSLTS